ncbi:polysaccharide deacetylase family protein [Cecembia calidifontis]|uniref:Polysaccharide deacetylase n=1 Tax=Cecembia calidifontis TaxID=1187080 RepID=A0A4Q7PBT2_9BACT|nr:polysaccharide deacetylase family protein [Cecembia calidifontis]RZS97467.1 polysaccharide deacetylase [Cecembia calidifontis]
MKFLIPSFILLLISFDLHAQELSFSTQILKWPQGKKAAISMTYDDGTYNQFKVALPIMEEFGMRGTFYINTGEIPGQKQEAKFLGRDPMAIIAETAQIPTSEENLFERAGLIRFLDMPGAVSYHDRAGAAFEQGRKETAFQLIDEGFAKAREGKISTLKAPQIIDGPMIGWDELRSYAARGHEFGVHTISHPRLAVLDEKNLLFELEKCAEDIERELGKDFLFSAECPFGTENERVMEYALDLFPATRNRMPEPWLEEINRSGRFDPKKDYETEYVQWQRGPLSQTSPELMKSWVDDILTRNDTWLVLVFHGIEGIGWEAIPETRIRDYFQYIASKSDDIWVATFAEVTKYLRQRMASTVHMSASAKLVEINLQSDLDPFWYDQTLYLKTYLPKNWTQIQVSQNGKLLTFESVEDKDGRYVIYPYLLKSGSVSIKAE